MELRQIALEVARILQDAGKHALNDQTNPHDMRRLEVSEETGAVLSRPTILVRGRHRRRDQFRTQHAGMDHHRDIIRIQRPVLRTADPFGRARSGAGIDVSCGAWIRCDPYS